MDQSYSNITHRFNIISRSLMFQWENYNKRVWGQLENTHSGRALKLSWNSRAWFAKNLKSVSAAERGSIGEGDGVVPCQECHEGIKAIDQSNMENVATTQSIQEPNRGSVEAAWGEEGWRRARRADAVLGGLTQAQLGQRRGNVTQSTVMQALPEQCRGWHKPGRLMQRASEQRWGF